MSDPERLAVVIGLSAVVVWNLYVSVRLLFSDSYSASQKFAQLLIIWLFPVVGTVFVHSMMVARPVRKREFYEAGSGPPGMGSDVGHH